jgi:hypothetical protein
MKNKRKYLHIIAFCSLVSTLVLLSMSCSQYDYSSPLPGIVEVRLHTIVDTTKISFSPLNNFTLNIAQMWAFRSDGARAEIVADLKALTQTQSGGSSTRSFNTLDYRAADSSLIMGETYLPPGNYTAVFVQKAQPGKYVVLDGYRDIPIVNDSIEQDLLFRRPFTITEGHHTKIVLTINLDSSLVRLADQFYFNPLYYISSIQYE